jgi:hypothetical protein
VISARFTPLFPNRTIEIPQPPAIADATSSLRVLRATLMTLAVPCPA